MDQDPRKLPEYVQKRLARGRTNAVIRHCEESDDHAFLARLNYDHKEDGAVQPHADDDNSSIRSTLSEDDENDDYSMKAMGCRSNAVRWITVSEDGEWKQEIEEM